MLRHLTLIVTLLIPNSGAAGQEMRTGPAIDVIRYRFFLEVSDDSNQIEGKAEITFRVPGEKPTSASLDLDDPNVDGTGMRVSSVVFDGIEVDYVHSNDRLGVTLPESTPARTPGELTISYKGVPSDGLIISENKHGERTFFGDNWPNRAHKWLPTNDHPSDKAYSEFVVTAPDRYRVVSNGQLIEETQLGDGRRLTHWRSGVPLPTKVMVIGVAQFAVQHLGNEHGAPIESWVYPQDRDAGFHDFALAGPIVQFFVDRIGPFPFEKLANVQSTTRYGGMENAGAIFYHENSVRGDRSTENLLAHEIAHQWFGDSVTEADWPHVWLSEGFATYLAALYNEYKYGPVRLQQIMDRARSAVVAFERRAPKTSVIDSSASNLMDLLNPFTYQKGAWVLHMLRAEIGDAAFWEGLSLFYRTYRDRNASTDDFRHVMEQASGHELGGFFGQWLEQPGHPRVQGTWSYEQETGKLRVEITQTGGDYSFPLELGLVSRSEQLTKVERVSVDGPNVTFSIQSPERPEEIVLDPAVKMLVTGELNGKDD